MLKDLIAKKKSLIVDRWVQSIINTYPPETSNFLRQQKDRFSNPVGYIISSSVEKIFEEIINGRDNERIKTFLNDIIKIRAIQNFSPSQATGFVYSLKKIIHKELEQEIPREKIIKELIDIDSYIDDLALTAFDIYMDVREKLFKIRINEIKSNSLYNNVWNKKE